MHVRKISTNPLSTQSHYTVPHHNKLFILGLFFILPQLLFAETELTEVTLSMKQPVPQAHWILSIPDNKTKVSSKILIDHLTKIKQNQFNQSFENCLAEIKNLKNIPESLVPWILNTELICATQKVKENKSSYKVLPPLITKLQNHPQWLLQGAYANSLQDNLISAKLALLGSLSTIQRSQAWHLIDDLFSIRQNLNKSQLAFVYRTAGEIAFTEQNLRAARNFVLYSLELEPSRDLEEKLAGIDSSLSNAKVIKSDNKASKESDLDASDDEIRIVARMKLALESGDIVSGVEDGIHLIQQFPGGRRAKWAANRILEVYFSLYDKSDDKNYDLLRLRVLKQMEKSDAIRLADWSRELYNKSSYSDCLRLAKASLSTLEGTSLSTKIILIAAKAAHYTGNLKEAVNLYKELIEKHSGTSESKDAIFYVGLIEYRLQEYATAVAYFERLLALPDIDKWENSARYWLWRTLQNINPENAKEQAKILGDKMPFSYYGIRAVAELNENKVGLASNPTQSQNISASLWLTPSQKKSWNTIETLLAAGWLNEARIELDQFPITNNNSKTKLLMAKYWAAALNYPKAIGLINQAWNEIDAFRDKSIVEIAFPQEMLPIIKKDSSKYKINPILVLSLIRQESAYDLNAVSRSQAYGLMQLISPTAKEVATDLRLKAIKIPQDLFKPELNISLGTYYLNKMISQFKGHVPFALAAYNAGPTRVLRWVNAQQGRFTLENMKNSDPKNEIWIDELPWEETRFYVKAILRNTLIYQMLGQKNIELGSSIWLPLISSATTDTANK